MFVPMDNVCIQFDWNWTDIVLADIFGKMALSYFEIFVSHVIEREPSYPVDIVLKWFINIIKVEIFNEFAIMPSHLNAFNLFQANNVEMGCTPYNIFYNFESVEMWFNAVSQLI